MVRYFTCTSVIPEGFISELLKKHDGPDEIISVERISETFTLIVLVEAEIQLFFHENQF
jgi:hypothetical protein